MKFSRPLLLVVAILTTVGCGPDESSERSPLAPTSPSFARSDDDPIVSPLLAQLNVNLRSAGVLGVEIDRAEYLTDVEGAQAAGQTLVANSRTHQLTSQFVKGDPRRGGLSSLLYLVDQSDGTAISRDPVTLVQFVLTNAVTEGAVDRSMARWRDQPGCNAPQIAKVADNGSDPDLIDGIVFNNLALIGVPRADITHAGWLPSAFFNALRPGGATSILGVTFTFVFINPNGTATDINRDGAADVAFREIYYNRNFFWGLLNPRAIDLESVITHEAGHGYGLAHFGKLFITNSNARLHFAPRAVMNGGYVSPFQDLVGSDNASFCSIWASSH